MEAAPQLAVQNHRWMDVDKLNKLNKPNKLNKLNKPHELNNLN
jgi:hypothetical protein